MTNQVNTSKRSGKLLEMVEGRARSCITCTTDTFKQYFVKFQKLVDILLPMYLSLATRWEFGMWGRERVSRSGLVYRRLKKEDGENNIWVVVELCYAQHSAFFYFKSRYHWCLSLVNTDVLQVNRPVKVYQFFYIHSGKFSLFFFCLTNGKKNQSVALTLFFLSSTAHHYSHSPSISNLHCLEHFSDTSSSHH